MSTDTYIDFFNTKEEAENPTWENWNFWENVRLGYLYNFVGDFQMKNNINKWDSFQDKWNTMQITNDNILEIINQYKDIYHTAQSSENGFHFDMIKPRDFWKILHIFSGKFMYFRVD